MPPRKERTIDRRTVGKISRLQLRARSAVEGYYTGIHKSPYHGFNVEFAEYREYSPGDDLRYLDWRVLAKTNHMFIKQFEAETNLSCYILLDASGSMDFSTAGETRLDYACGLAASLSLLMLRQGDQAGLVVFDNAVRSFIPPRGNARHFGAIVDALERVKPGNDTHIGAVLHEIAERVRRRSMVIVISDFFDDVDALLNGLQHFRHRRHEVIVLQLLDDAEVDFPYDRITLFEGMERGEEVVVDPRIVAEGYRARLRQHLESLRRGCTEKNIDYERMQLSEPFDKALTAYLGRRR
ncbi:MAG: DUF58 domain-containing protein [Candidatus Brocadiae bacterium]|nr:DUF58 domain-containing protein [Candidatus Brocadiia bacterium]